MKAFRLLVNRSATWAEWDERLLAIEFGQLAELNFEPTLTGFDPREIDLFMAAYDAGGDAQLDSVPELPENPVSRTGDLWLCGKHRALCGDSTSSDNVARLLGERHQPLLLVTDPPYGIELDSEWRDRAGLNGCGPAEASYMKHRGAVGPCDHACHCSNSDQIDSSVFNELHQLRVVQRFRVAIQQQYFVVRGRPCLKQEHP
ncbi:MAG TPA: hypothetical protein VN777_02905 [Terriglobales bacterium]|nr:hypothetical protein [Terriglobales bacterium]